MAFSSNTPESLDFSALHERPRISRGSALATALYAATAVVGLLFVLLLASPVKAPLWFLASLALLLLLQFIGVRHTVRRTDPARPDDLWRFADANSFRIISLSDPAELGARVYLRTKMSAWLPRYMRWPYDTPLTIEGSYRSLPIALYNLTLATSPITDSTIEQDQAYAAYTRNDQLAALALTLPYTSREASVRPGAGVIIWQLPNVSTKALNQLRRRLGVFDVQTDGIQLAILLDSHIPYDRKGLQRLFQSLDKAYVNTVTV